MSASGHGCAIEMTSIPTTASGGIEVYRGVVSGFSRAGYLRVAQIDVERAGVQVIFELHGFPRYSSPGAITLTITCSSGVSTIFSMREPRPYPKTTILPLSPGLGGPVLRLSALNTSSSVIFRLTMRFRACGEKLGIVG